MEKVYVVSISEWLGNEPVGVKPDRVYSSYKDALDYVLEFECFEFGYDIEATLDGVTLSVVDRGFETFATIREQSVR